MGFDPNANTLYLRVVSTHISRWELTQTLAQTGGFRSLSLSEALKNQGFVRYAWVSYESQENADKAKLWMADKILGREGEPRYRFGPMTSTSARKPVRVAPALTHGRLLHDVNQSRQLLQILDLQKGILVYIYTHIYIYIYIIEQSTMELYRRK